MGKRRSRSECIIVGAHMRRGNYLEDSRLEYGHIPASKEYLLRAIAYFRRKLSTPERSADCILFLVLGNDYIWNLVNSPRSPDVVVLAPHKSAALDLCILAESDHVIMSVGTFGWWAGFLSRGHVTYKKEYARPNSQLSNLTNPADFYLPNWVPL